MHVSREDAHVADVGQKESTRGCTRERRGGRGEAHEGAHESRGVVVVARDEEVGVKDDRLKRRNR